MKILVEEELLAMLQSTLEANRLVMQKLEQKETGDKPLSLAEASQYLGVARSTLQGYIRAGEITPSEYGSRVWVIRRELDNFIARHRRKKY